MELLSKKRSLILLAFLPIALFVALWKMAPPRPVPLPELGGGVLAFSADGTKLVCGGIGRSGSFAKIWDIPTHRLETTIDTKATYTKSVAFSPDGTKLATGVQGASWPDEKLPVSIWDIKTGKQLSQFAGAPNQTGARGLHFSPDGQLLCGAKHGDIYFWDVAKGYQVKQSIPAGMDVYSVGYNGQVLIFGGTNGVKVYSMNPQQALPTPPVGWGSVYAVALSADGSTAAASGQDPTVVVWDVKTGKVKMKAPQPGYGSVNAVALSPDGATVVSSGTAGVLIWNIGKGVVQRNLGPGASSGEGSFVVFSADGSKLATSSWQEVKLWYLH